MKPCILKFLLVPALLLAFASGKAGAVSETEPRPADGTPVVVAPAAAPVAVPFMDYAPDPQSAGIGQIGTVLPATAFSLWNNPAAAALSERRAAAGLVCGLWQPSLGAEPVISAAGYGKVGKRMAVSAGVKYFTHTANHETDETGRSTGRFSPMDLMAGAGVSFEFMPHFSVGANLHYVRSALTAGKAFNGASADIGALAEFSFLKAGLTISHLGMKADYGGAASYNLPAVLRAGMAATRQFGADGQHELTAAVQGGVFLFYPCCTGALGVEYRYQEAVRVSAGCHYGNPKTGLPPHLSLGLGFRVWKARIDASWLAGLAAGSPLTSSFSLGVGIEL